MNREYHSRPRDEAMEKIEWHIRKNQVKPHAKLPSERDLCELWGLNRTTLRSAIKRLIAEGKLYNKKGSGTFVAESKIMRNLQDSQSITELLANKGKDFESKVLSFRLIPCTKQLSNTLHVSIGRGVYELIRLRMLDGEPLMLERTCLSEDRFPELIRFDFEKESLYEVLKNHYSVMILGGNEKVGMTYAGKNEADQLNLQEETALFYLDGVAWDEKKEPVESFQSWVRADRIQLFSVLKR
jgi:GntR family transcriptional regulator